MCLSVLIDFTERWTSFFFFFQMLAISYMYISFSLCFGAIISSLRYLINVMCLNVFFLWVCQLIGSLVS